VITGEMDTWLKQTVLQKTPVTFGYDTNLWTCAILADLLKKEFGVMVSASSALRYLRAPSEEAGVELSKARVSGRRAGLARDRAFSE
jgi:transposase